MSDETASELIKVASDAQVPVGIVVAVGNEGHTAILLPNGDTVEGRLVVDTTGVVAFRRTAING